MEIELDATSWLFEPGHRIRLSISNADFPNTWPGPTLATSRLHFGAERPSRLVLPVVSLQVVAPFPEPVFDASPFPLDEEHPPAPQFWQVTRDQMRGRTEVAIQGSGSGETDPGFVTESSFSATASVDERDPARAWMRGRQEVRYRWPGQTIRMRSHGQIVSSAAAFNVSFHVELTVDEMPHFERRWTASFPRHLI